MVGSIISTYMMFLPQKTQWFCLIGLGIAIFGIWIPYEEHKKKKKQKNQSKKQETARRTGLEADRKKLEQLKTLKNAGLLSEEEYLEKKREIR